MLEGDEIPLKRVLSLLKQTINWYVVIAVIFSIIIIPVGLVFFKNNNNNVNYIVPWILLVVFNALGLITYSFTAIMEGLNKVAEIQFMRMLQTLIGSISIWVVLLSHGKLYAAAILAIINFLVLFFWMKIKYKNLLKQVFQFSMNDSNRVSWRKEIWPVQWKIAISWASGYIIFQSINPVLFKYQGAVEAGKMGMTNSLANIALSIGLSWVVAKTPIYGGLINKGEFNKLNSTAIKNTQIALFVTTICSTFLVIGMLILFRWIPSYKDKILPIYALIALLINSLVSVIITSIACYLRAFKKEPLLVSSIFSAIVIAVLIFIAAKYFNAIILCYIITAFNLIVGLPIAIFILNKNKVKSINE
jgi:O-antigen/teichoic acid export membrane protein